MLLAGALHVDEGVWPIGALAPRASTPVRRARTIGGVAANVARAMRRHGNRDVALVAAVGDDPDADWLVAGVEAAGVEVVAQPVTGQASGRYTVVHDEHGELFVGLADTGIAESLAAAAVLARIAERPVAALVVDANLAADGLAALLAADDRADSMARIALAVSPAKARRLVSLLPVVDLLFCNRREAAALVGQAPDTPLGTLADGLVALGSRRLVLSDGAGAVLVQTPDERTLLPVPPLAAAVASVNGAGDALAGATLDRWLDTGDLVAAVHEAGLPAAAAIVTTQEQTP